MASSCPTTTIKGTPNWVSWRLTKADSGNVPRTEFFPDQTLPEGFKKVLPSDYKQSGFDRGHMCPHGDRSATEPPSDATFVMSNMVPQSPHNNQKGWNQLELYCRGLVSKGKFDCYIVAGPTGMGGAGSNGPRLTLGSNNKIVVPSHTWKVIMVVPAGVKQPAEVKGAKTRLIAVMMPNDQSVTFDWAMHRRTVEEIETKTDLKFFSLVTDPAFLAKKDDVDQVSPGPPIAVDHGN